MSKATQLLSGQAGTGPMSDPQASAFSASLSHKISIFAMVTSKETPVKYQQVEWAIFFLLFSKD